MKKKLLGLLLAVYMIASLAACSGSTADTTTDTNADSASTEETSSASSGDVLKIGVAAGITGNAPLEGERMQQAVELALEQYNETDGSITIELDVQDTQGTTAGALNAVQRCISDGCQVILGPHGSTLVLSVGETVDEAQVPFISGGTSPNLIGQFEYLYTCRTNDTYAAQIGAQACVETLGATNVGIFYCSDDYGSGGTTVASAYFEEQGIPYSAEAYNTGDTDVSGQILSLMNSGADCLFVWANGVDLAMISRTMNQLGCELPIVSSSSVAVQQYIDLCEPEWLEGWYGVGEYVESSDREAVQQYAADFLEYTGETGELFGSTYYGAFQAVIEAVELGGGIDSESIKNGLSQIQGLEVVLGTYNCDENNNLMHECSLIQMELTTADDGSTTVAPVVIEQLSVDY